MKTKYGWMTLFSLLMITTLAGCGAQATPTLTPIQVPTAEPPKQVMLVAGEVASPIRILEDADSSLRASEKRAISGDKILDNLYERPFTSKAMVYQPDINILKVSIAGDADFYYFTLTLQGLDPAAKTLTGTYGIEFDRSKTGQGDLLVRASTLKEEWSFENVHAYIDQNKDVGGYKPIVAEEGFKGDGYETEVKLEGDKVAYARTVAGDPPIVQIAVSKALMGDAAEFLWGGWADKGINDPKLFDYNDYFGPNAAGSPINTDKDYPLKGLYSLDNTCRLPFGFEPPMGTIPGMCLSIPAKVEGSSSCVCVRWNVTRNPPSCTLYRCG
jgi:hypothetical protein